MQKKSLLAALLAAFAIAPAFAAGAGGCPPGLAKKHNGCQPPGQAKKIYRDPVVGHRVPRGAVYVIPSHVRATLPRPPAGCRYAVVNDQVVLVSRDNVVVDIIRTIIG